MGQILGLGITHYPGLGFKGNLARRINLVLADPALPEDLRSPEHWPAPMREQWGDDEGEAHSTRHRQDMIDQFRRARQELDAFQPDFVVIWGDDQYENFKEDCVPPFAVLAYDSAEVRPWEHASGRGSNSWDEPEDKSFTIQGHRAGGKFVVGGLLREGFDVAYAYEPLHGAGLGHAIVNSVLYLDWDRRGFPYPVVPITVNAGRSPPRSPWRSKENSTPPARSPGAAFSSAARSRGRWRPAPGKWRSSRPLAGPTPSSCPSTRSCTLTSRPTGASTTPWSPAIGIPGATCRSNRPRPAATRSC
jgi:hypothetical protein